MMERGEKKHTRVIQGRRTCDHADVSAEAHHEGDLLAGLRLPADQKDAAAEEEEAHGQQNQGPHVCPKDGADVVGGEVAEHAHDSHCGAREVNTHTHTHTHVCWPTQHTDGHLDHAGGMLGRRVRGLQDGLQGGAATFEHVEVGL